MSYSNSPSSGVKKGRAMCFTLAYHTHCTQDSGGSTVSTKHQAMFPRLQRTCQCYSDVQTVFVTFILMPAFDFDFRSVSIRVQDYFCV